MGDINMSGPISFDSSYDFASKMAIDEAPTAYIAETFSDLIRESYTIYFRIFQQLPQLDRQLIQLFYLNTKLTQDQVANFLSISQAAVSHRLKSLPTRIRFLLKRPTSSRIQVRRDLEKILPNELIEVGILFYWEVTHNRVKHFIETSNSGASNKFTQLLSYLKEFKKQLQHEMVQEMDQKEKERLEEVFLITTMYLEYFIFISNRSNIIMLSSRNSTEELTELVSGTEYSSHVPQLVAS